MAEVPAGHAPAVVALSGELDASDRTWADEIRLAGELGAGRVVVDLLNVTFVDSSVIGELAGAAAELPTDGWLRLVYTHYLIDRVLTICGLTERFPQYPSVSAALRGAPAGQRRERRGGDGGRARGARGVKRGRPGKADLDRR